LLREKKPTLQPKLKISSGILITAGFP
jgi:hypothetical protein